MSFTAAGGRREVGMAILEVYLEDGNVCIGSDARPCPRIAGRGELGRLLPVNAARRFFAFCEGPYFGRAYL